jgi:hypothetical protein
MADRPRDAGWWQAADGKWYPPELLDAPRPQWPTTEQVPVVVPNPATVVPSPTPTIVAIVVASVLSLLGAFTGFRLASVIRASGDPAFVDNEPTYVSETGLWASTSAMQYLSIAVAAVLLIVFLYRVSKALSARGPEGTTWGKGWTIGGWFVPIANLIIPRLVVGELEKIVQVPYGGVPIGSEWRKAPRSVVSDIWWLMWVAGQTTTWVGTVGGNTSLDDNGTFTAFLMVASISSLLVAGSGVALSVTVRTLARDAAR